MPIDNRMSKEDKEKLLSEAINDTPEPEAQDTPDENNDSKDVEAPEDNKTPVDDSPEEKPAEEKPTPPLEKRYKESTREAQVLHLKNKKITETVLEARNLPEPTEEELKQTFPEWDDMTPTEQKLAKNSVVSERKFSKVYEAVEEGHRIDEWSEKVDNFLLTGVTQFKRLSGNEDEFKAFAMKPSRRGIELEDLARAFLFDATEKTEKKRGSLLESGSGGGQSDAKDPDLSESQISAIRKGNHKLYQKLIRDKKIKPQLLV